MTVEVNGVAEGHLSSNGDLKSQNPTVAAKKSKASQHPFGGTDSDTSGDDVNGVSGTDSSKANFDPQKAFEHVEVEYVPETPELAGDLDEEFRKVFEKFSFKEAAGAEMNEKPDEKAADAALKKKADSDSEEEEQDPQQKEKGISNKKKKLQRRMKIADLKQISSKPDVVEVKLREMKPGMLSQELKEALGMPEGAPPPWLINMQGGKGHWKSEGVMADDFYWSYTDEPHASRRRQILSQYPQIKKLFGPDPFAFSKISAVVLLQLWTTTFLHDASWMKILIVAYFFGSFLNHNLFLAIHELSHNLAFETPVYNRWLGIFANLPIGVPMSVTFQKYHLEHHRFQGVDGIDMDIPSRAEAYFVRNAFSKSIWVILQLFFYALRPLFIKPKPPGMWEFINLTVQISLDAAMVYIWGWKSFAYMILSTFVGGGMHPMAGHFISEHYVFKPEQETYSYYGPLNLMTWSVGYHNEHHDFPRIPGSKLHKIKEIAPEYYENFMSYKSWSQVIYMYIMDRTVGPFSRMKRKLSNDNEKKSG